jgi:PAS domain S-box-containing protein
MRDLKAKFFKQLRHSLPVGGSLPDDVWRGRHRFLVALTWFHVAIIALTGPVFGYTWTVSIAALFEDGTVLHTFAESLVVAFFAGLAGCSCRSRAFRATAVSFGLMSASAIIVHLSGGHIEFHFHFFVMLFFLALYQDWVPYLFAIGFVAIHHGTVGVLWPSDVYNHPAALNAPWTWAGIHAFFVLWSSVGSVIAWRFNERAYAQTQRILDSAGEGIFGLDCNGVMTFINPAAANLLGLNESHALGQPLMRILEHRRADGSPFLDGVSPILASLKNGKPRRGTDEIFQRSDGMSFPADYYVTPTIERNELTGLVVTFSDVTERHRADNEIQHNLRRIRALHEIDVAITSSLDLRHILDVLLEKIDLFFDYASASTVRLLDPSTGALAPAACRNLDPNEWQTKEWKSGGRIPKMVFESLAPVMVANVQLDPRITNGAIFKNMESFLTLAFLSSPRASRSASSGCTPTKNINSASKKSIS